MTISLTVILTITLTHPPQGTGLLPDRPPRPSDADLPSILASLNDEHLASAVR